MSNNGEPSKPISDAALIDADTIGAVLQEQSDDRSKTPFDILCTEPVLSDFLHQEVLKLLGKLALSGVRPEIVRGVSTDLHRLLGVTAGAFRLAYRDLLEDLLPEEEVDPPADQSGEIPRPTEDPDTDDDANVPF